MYSSVLGGRLAGIGEPNLREYHAAMKIPPPPTGPSFQRIQKDLLIAAEYVANMSMMEAKIRARIYNGNQSPNQLCTCCGLL